MSQNLRSDDVDSIVEHFLNKLIDKCPQMKAQISAHRTSIKSAMCLMLNNRYDLKTADFSDKGFIKELTETFTAAVGMSVGKDKALNLKIKNLLQEFGLVDKFGKGTGLKLTPEASKKFKLTLTAIFREFTNTYEDALKALKLSPLDKKNKKEPAEMLADESMQKIEVNPYANLDSLISMIAGCLPVVITYYAGNQQGFTDKSPYNGPAPINRINDPNDNDDPLLNAITMGNFLQEVGGFLASTFNNDLKEMGYNVNPSNPSTIKTPHPPGTDTSVS